MNGRGPTAGKWINLPQGPARYYAAVMLGVSLAIGWLLYGGLGFGVAESTLIPALSCAIALGTWRPFVLAVPVLLCALIAEASPLAPLGGADGITASLAVLALVLVVTVLRYQALEHGIFPQALRDRASFESNELWLLWLPVTGCFLVAGLWLSWLGSGERAVEDYRLYPNGLLTIKLVLSLLAVFVVLHGSLEYLRWRRAGRGESSLYLRHEVWKWCGHEQKMVARLDRRRGRGR